MAQRVLSSLSDGEIAKGTDQWYRAKITNNKILIENTQNKFTNVKQNSPNMDPTYRPGKFEISLDKDPLLKICAKYTKIDQLRTLVAEDQYAGLMIDLRTDIFGNVIEVSFFTDKNSTLSLQQIEQIENNIKSSRNLVTISPYMQKILKGSNFWISDPRLLFFDILKVKQEMERPKRPSRNERN
jgi:hypothetical protein